MNSLSRDTEAKEEQRAISASMSELASMCGNLETEVRRLASRIRLALPGGSPFDAIDKQAGMPATTSVGREVAPCRSHLTEELQSRIYQLRELGNTVGGMAERIEL